jgi:hypothetical protein
MNQKFSIQTESIKGTKFSIEFEIDDNGSWKLTNLPYRKSKDWNWNTNYYYNKYPLLKDLIFIVEFIRQNKIKMSRLKARDLSELICMLLEIEPTKNLAGEVIQRKYPDKILALTHTIKDIQIKFKEI